MSTPMEDTLAELSNQQRERIEQLTADAKERDAEIATMAARLEEALDIIDCLADSDECSLDHLGYCQAHYWFGDTECPNARARRLIEQEPAPVVEVSDGH